MSRLNALSQFQPLAKYILHSTRMYTYSNDNYDYMQRQIYVESY